MEHVKEKDVVVHPSMTRNAVDPVKLEFERETVLGNKPLPFGSLHDRCVRESHMPPDRCRNPPNEVSRHFETGQYLLRNFSTELLMSVEVIYSILPDFRGWGLADIVEKYRPGKFRRCRSHMFKHEEGMHEHIALGMIFLGLSDPFHGADFWKDMV